MEKFKIGDRVRIRKDVTDAQMAGFPKGWFIARDRGEVHTVDAVSLSIGNGTYFDWGGTGWKSWCDRDIFEKVVRRTIVIKKENDNAND